MFKLLRIIIPLALVLGIVYFLMAYQVIRISDGYRIVKKDELKFSTPVIDTRDWKFSDYLKNPDIAKKIGEFKLDQVKESIADSWKDLKRTLDKWVGDIDTDNLSDSARKEMESLQKAIKEKYNELDRQYQNGDINLDGFKGKFNQLRQWADQQWESFRKDNLQE